MLRIATLNVRHGGGERAGRLLKAISCLSPDALVITEYRNNRAGQAIREGLQNGGWSYQLAASAPERVNSVLIAGRSRVALDERFPATDWRRDRHLVVRTDVCTFVAVYLPPGPTKIPGWERVLSTAKALAPEPAILIGDFNTGKHCVDEDGKTFIAPEYLDHLEALGYVDAWRSLNPKGREYTWYSPAGRGYRLDYAFISPVLAPSLASAHHVDEPRLEATTDHSVLVVELR